MQRKTIAGFILTLLLSSMLTFAFNIQLVKASGTIYIRADGSIDPSSAPISTSDYITYVFTDNITDSIVIQRSNIIINGNGSAVQGAGSGIGFKLDTVYSVTIKDVSINDFEYGIYFNCSFSNVICRNNITENNIGVYLSYSNLSRFYHNNFVNNAVQVYIDHAYSNAWDYGYPFCGNYWDGYSSADIYSGPFQNETGSDGIGDTPYGIGEENTDNFPLMDPWTPDFTVLNCMAVAYSNAPADLDPARFLSNITPELFLNVYETLTFLDEEKTDQFVPRLATDWEMSEDGLNYTFTIREGVKFHNNETLTTEDVEYSFERIVVIEGGYAFIFYDAFFDVFQSRDSEGNFTITGEQIDNAVTRNETTVTFHLAKPYPPFMQAISQTWSSIICKKWCVSIGDWPGTWNNWTLYNRPSETAIEAQNTEPPGPHINAMCGTGPFIFDYYQTGVEWSMKKFDNYWGGWPASGSKDFIQRVIGKKISNWETRKSMFLEGLLDHIQVPTDKIDEVLGQPDIECIYPLVDLSCYALFFTFNMSTSSPYMGVPGGLPYGTLDESGIPPDFFSDIDVRKGFAYAFNYSKLIEEAVRGEAFQPATPIIPNLPFYNPAQEKYSINLTKAWEHFSNAWGGTLLDYGFNFTMCYRAGSLSQQKTCEIIKENVESLSSNFHIQLQSLSGGIYFYSAENHSLPAFAMGWLADFADPHNFAFGFMHSDGTFASFQRYSNGTIDTLVEEGVSTMNETERRQIYYELQELYHQDCPSFPTHQPMQRRFQRDWVQGWYHNPLFWMMNYFYVQWKGSMREYSRYSWPMFHHDLEHTGYTETPAPNTNQTIWNYATGGIVYGPVIAEGRVYFGSGDNKTYCLDALTGALIWNYTTGNWVSSSPAVVDGRVYVGSDDKNVYCLDALTGALIWNYTTGYWVFSSPAVADGKVYVGSCDNKVYCLDALTGALIWNYTTGGFVRSCPAVVGGKVYVGSDDNKTYCLNALTGAHIWNYTTGYLVGSSPAVVNGKVYIGSYDTKTYCLDALTGALIWNYTTGGYVFSSPAVVDDKVYVGSCDNKVYCLDASTGTQIWNYVTGYYVTSSPAVADGKVYVGSYDTKVYCLDASTGAHIWSYKTGINWVHSSPAVADGMVFVGSDDGTVYAFGNVVWTEDYNTIQEAINAAAPGSTVIVAPGIYHESLVVNKTLMILGLLGSAPVFAGGGSGIAITLLQDASGSIIAGIVITHWDQGILMIDTSNCRIYDNIMSLMNYNGISFEGTDATDNVVYNNIFEDNAVAINLTASSTSNTIYKNIISLNYIGLILESGGNIIYANTIAENEFGICILTSNNIIYHNNFIGNTFQISISTSVTNTWDNGYSSGGNYWSAHVTIDQKCGSNQDQEGSDGIVDVSYTIAVNNVDRYPLVQPFNAHDLGITNVNTSKTIIGRGFCLYVDLKILNYGVYDETFTLTIFANAFTISPQTISLTRRNSTIITIEWNTTGIAYGDYNIRVVVDIIPGETDIADNTFLLEFPVHVGIPGDVSSSVLGVLDGKVNIRDINYLVLLFMTKPTSKNWNPNADINNDGVVNIRDINIVVQNFNKQE